MAYMQKTKLVLKDLGEPAVIKTLDESVKQHLLGTILGIASKIVERKSPDGQDRFEGLGGEFRCVPSDPKLEPCESGIMFMPDAFHSMVAAMLKEAGDGGKVNFAFEVYVVRAKNPAGYSWSFQPLIEGEKKSALDMLIENNAKIAASKPLKALAAPDKKK